MNNYDAVTTDLIETLPYKKLVQEMYSETTEDVSDKIERDAKTIANDLQQSIDKEAKEVSDGVMELIDGFEMDI
jgi:predicted transcriptional regulator